MEDIAKPFKVHLKEVHEVIIFIINHDVPYGVFSSYDGVRALLIPAETRFATELICVRSTMDDKELLERLFVEKQVVEWADRQPAEIKAKYRKHRANILSIEWWHKSTVFCAVEEVVESSLRMLDSDKPNLKDTAFGYYNIKTEFGDPLLGKLAGIKDWGTINLCLDLGTEQMGTLASYVNHCLKK